LQRESKDTTIIAFDYVVRVAIMSGQGHFRCGALVICACLVVGCSQSESTIHTAQEMKPVDVSVISVVPTPIRDIIVLPGQTEAWQDVRLASDTDGVVEWVGVNEGGEVARDQLVAKVDVSALKAALERAEASFALADDVYKRRELLYERKVIAKEELDRSLTERTVALNILRQARVEYQRGFVRSPVEGVVNLLHVDVGEYVARGAPVVDLVNVRKIKVTVNVPEMDVRYLLPGDRARITVDAFPDRQFDGLVHFVAYKADSATKTFRVEVAIDNPERRIRPGMIARVTFLRRVIPGALVAPLHAIVDKGGERVVFIAKDGTAYSRTVSIGVIEGDRVQITSGLSIGDQLIIKGHTRVEDGTPVAISARGKREVSSPRP